MDKVETFPYSKIAAYFVTYSLSLLNEHTQQSEITKLWKFYDVPFVSCICNLSIWSSSHLFYCNYNIVHITNVNVLIDSNNVCVL